MAKRRGVGFVLSLIALAVLVSVAGMLLVFVLASRGPSLPRSAVLVLRPGGDIQELAPADVFGQLLGRDINTVRGFVESLARAKDDPRITSVLLLPSTLASPYWGKVQEMRDAVLDFRESGKPIVAFLEFGGDREYYLASAAEHVYLLPTSPLDLTGVATYEIFLRGLFDKVGVEPDFLKIGDYKTAPNQLTERRMTPAHREMTEALNRDMYAQLVRGIAESRGKSEADVRAIVDQGPFVPEEAKRLGLVDDLVYLDEVDDRVPELREGDRATRWLEGADYRRAGAGSLGFGRARVAVLYVSGTIVSGRSVFDPLNGALVGSDTIVDELRRIRADRSIRAIVLRVDSPGGSSVASDVIWRELTITREQRPSRPIIVSMSDLAASGGYYVATPGQVIVAQPGTLTGSIGIYAGKLTLGGTLDKLGVTRETVTSGANADIYSPFDRFTPGQRAKVDAFMRTFYDGFVAKVAASRGKTVAEIDAVAQGRVWTGEQAKARGLVDELGGLDVAVRLAKQNAGIPAGDDVELVTYPSRRSFYEALGEQFGVSTGANLLQLFTRPSDARAVGAVTAPMRIFRSGEPLALMPFVAVR